MDRVGAQVSAVCCGRARSQVRKVAKLPGWPELAFSQGSLSEGRLHVSCVIDSDNESITLGAFQSRRWPVERNHGRTRSPYTAAGYPRATSRGRRAVAGELGSSLV